MIKMSDVPVVVSIIALIISGYSLLISRNLSNVRLQAMQTAALTARLNMRLVNDRGRQEFSLKISNSGQAVAKNIEILINNQPALEYAPLRINAAMYGISDFSNFIISQLDAGTDIEYPLQYSVGTPARINIELKWSDDSEMRRSFTALLLPILTR